MPYRQFTKIEIEKIAFSPQIKLLINSVARPEADASCFLFIFLCITNAMLL